ncbi:hypothetical protein F5I97DRAFT_1928028 [Phlebopus sp. FC_14]|nr:hypothetical protein F5I97DRAFT_1928028 [Phlebopus sp. FC_14]
MLSFQGGPTITKVQWLMKTGFFGDQAHPDMVLSLTTRTSYPSHAPSNHVYPFKSRPLLGDSDSVHLRSDWAESWDATPHDVTFQAAEERESQLEGLPNGGTFYRSYCASLPIWDQLPGIHDEAHLRMFSPSDLLAVTYLDFTLHPTPTMAGISEERDAAFGSPNDGCIKHESLRENDGVVPLFSQYHPFECKYAATLIDLIDDCKQLKPYPGLWSVLTLPDTTRLSTFPFGQAHNVSENLAKYWSLVEGHRPYASRDLSVG